MAITTNMKLEPYIFMAISMEMRSSSSLKMTIFIEVRLYNLGMQLGLRQSNYQVANRSTGPGVWNLGEVQVRPMGSEEAAVACTIQILLGFLVGGFSSCVGTKEEIPLAAAHEMTSELGTAAQIRPLCSL